MRRQVNIKPTATGYGIYFDAMASPCEVLLSSNDQQLAQQLANAVSDETWRIQDKYSRYQADSLCSRINASNGKEVAIDEETYRLLQFADQCYQLSNGLFDITSGILRRVWLFDGSDNLPTSQQVTNLLPRIGWQKVVFNQASVCLPAGMEIDFGGIGKEYAVDKVIEFIKGQTRVPSLVNFGGDLAVTGPRTDGQPWTVGIELKGLADKPTTAISFYQGGIATSGDANRYLLKDGKRYSHILNPQTGWPVVNAPSSVTVASSSCINAGIIATLAMLQGANAEEFLQQNEFKHWLYRA